MKKNFDEIQRLMFTFEWNELDAINVEHRAEPCEHLVLLGLLASHTPKRQRELIEKWGLTGLLQNLEPPYLGFTAKRDELRWQEAAASDPNEHWRLEPSPPENTQ